MFVAELSAIIIGFIYCRKSIVGKSFLFYLLFDFIICNIDLFIMPTQSAIRKSVFITVTNTLISLVELLTYYCFFFYALVSKKVRGALIFFGIVLISITILYLTK